MQNIRSQNLIPVPTGLLQIQNLPTDIKSIKFSSIVPTYNEKENIQQLITNLIQILDKIVPEEYELIVVDDDSTDRTWKNALELSTKYPQVRIARRKS